MKVLLLDNWTPKALNALDEVAYIDIFQDGVYSIDYEERFDGLITDLANPSLKYLSRFKNLKFIASCTTGLDHIPVDYCKDKGIKIISLQGERDFLMDVHATAEHTFALILSLIRKVPAAFEDVKQGNWERETWQGVELRDKVIGLIGINGRVATQVKSIATAFGLKVIGVDKNETRNNYEHVLKTSDIVSVHVPLDVTTVGLFGTNEFQQMKPTVLFINTSRGRVVDEEALLQALINKEIAGAALDVVCNEPNINKELMEYANTHNNLILTCHIGGNTAESREKCQLFIADKIKQFIQGGG